MSHKFLAFIVLFISISYYSSAQSASKTAIIKGKLVNRATKEPFSELKVSIPALNVFTNSDGEGNFVISEVPYGTQTLIISSYNAKSDTLSIVVDKDVVDLNDISIAPSEKGISVESSEIPTITIEENSNTSSEDDGVSSQSQGGAITSSRNPFLSAVVSLIAQYNFHYRGFKNNELEYQVNGVPLNNAETGAVSFNQFGKLYDVFRVRDVVYGLSPSSYAFGGQNGVEYFDATAANQYAETRVSYTLTDRNYNNGLSLTHSSGLNKNGWAYSVSFAKRWATEGYAPGTFYDDYSYYAAVSKVIKKGILNLTTVGSPIDHGKTASATQEAYDLDGSRYYNHDWGFYNGEKRNARVQKEFQPLTVLNYEYKPSDRTRWNTALGYEFGKNKNSFIDYYNASSPYGDYYKNMPSYYYTYFPADSVTGNAVKKQILSDPTGALQINWKQLYQDNYLNTQTINNVNGIAGNSYTGKQSVYVVSNAVNDLKRYNFNTNIEHSVNEHFNVYGGLSFTSQTMENYNQLADLLGGDYYINYNQFASQQYVGNPNYNQNNLNQPNAVIKVGDKYGSDYAIHTNNSLLWGQAVYLYDKFNFFIAANGGDNSFYRDGFMRNGLFANNSYGKSATENFLTYAVKGGINYNINPRNFLFINASYTATPPTPDNTFISAATRDYLVSSPSLQKNKSIEVGYFVKANKLSARITGYVTDMNNATEIKRFFNDDPAFYTFTNYVMTGENTRSLGTEISFNYKVARQLSVLGVVAIGQSFYTNNPNIAVYLDNDTTQHATPSKTYIKNYYVAAGPQTTYLLGLDYRPKRDLFVNINFHYFDRNYVEINPNRRTAAAGGLYTEGSPQWHQIFDQQKLPSAFTVDFRAGKNFQLSRMSKTINNISHKSVLRASVSVSNLLNNTNIINSGYEQLRYDFAHYNPDKFANKYMYAMGVNYSINLTLIF